LVNFLIILYFPMKRNFLTFLRITVIR